MTGCNNNNVGVQVVENQKEVARTVDWYMDNKNELQSKRTECLSSHDKLKETQNCINAKQAYVRIKLALSLSELIKIKRLSERIKNGTKEQQEEFFRESRLEYANLFLNLHNKYNIEDFDLDKLVEEMKSCVASESCIGIITKINESTTNLIKDNELLSRYNEEFTEKSNDLLEKIGLKHFPETDENYIK
jgi:hypothetical protein